MIARLRMGIDYAVKKPTFYQVGFLILYHCRILFGFCYFAWVIMFEI